MDSPLHLQRMAKRKHLKWEMTFSGVREHYVFPDFSFIIMLLMSVLSLIKAWESNSVLTFTAIISLWSAIWGDSIARKLCFSYDCYTQEQSCWQCKQEIKTDWRTRELMWHTHAHTHNMSMYTPVCTHIYMHTCTHRKFMKSWKKNGYSLFFIISKLL